MTVLLALFVERVLHQHRPQRQHRWFEAYSRTLTRLPLVQRPIGRPWGGALALLPPLVPIAWLQLLFAGLGGLFALVFGVTVLLYGLGPRDLGDETLA
jgi:membrane protein required for beta-lactamase induction